MKAISVVLASIALFAAGSLALPAAAADAPTVTCKDGTSSKGGRGACRGHGGVDKKAGKAASEKAAEAPAKETAAKAADEGKSAAMVTCKDGSSSKGGRGACRGHGGVNKNAGAAATESAPATAAPSAASAPAASEPAAAPAKSGSASGKGNTDSGDATAKCKDGTYSHAKGHKGACSHHGGVGEFLK